MNHLKIAMRQILKTKILNIVVLLMSTQQSWFTEAYDYRILPIFDLNTIGSEASIYTIGMGKLNKQGRPHLYKAVVKYLPTHHQKYLAWNLAPAPCVSYSLLHHTICSVYCSIYNVTIYNADQIAFPCVRLLWIFYPVISLGISSIPICPAFPSPLSPSQVASLSSVP